MCFCVLKSTRKTLRKDSVTVFFFCVCVCVRQSDYSSSGSDTSGDEGEGAAAEGAEGEGKEGESEGEEAAPAAGSRCVAGPTARHRPCVLPLRLLAAPRTLHA